MNNGINVNSEIGKLKSVLLHRPGAEVENITPDTMKQLLFDDIPYLKIAQKEHDFFAQTLRDNGAETVYIETPIPWMCSRSSWASRRNSTSRFPRRRQRRFIP